MQKFPTIKTERLVLSQLSAADIPRIVTYAAEKEISQYTLNIPFPYTEQDAIFWINQSNQGFKNGTQLIFAIRLQPELDFIGGIGLTLSENYHRAEIGYWVGKPFWNRGYTSEAVEAIIGYGFQNLQLNKLMATHLDKNPASGRVMLKNGMVQEGTLREHIFKDGAYFDLIHYGLTRKAFEKLSE
ncbi:GNAT family N-acetyltransferase [Flavilitoribacter nigricans DSM 23189 = NBRC 102662]|uniref:GNAT family N-acetyltransferase n=2 Tax=Flavilitoribacter TaxID=2762562 RepID=A0A2D0N939_FLAN2|nr:GNAT family N-acetyltransferase [Flavilitoribacter nigricans DSM 23189 = NBRC 102662]